MSDNLDQPNAEESAAQQTNDPRLAFIYQESIRALHHQQSFVENMNSRAGSVIFATAFANSLLGSRALADGLGPWDWVAAALLFLIGALIVFMLWPYHRYSFSFDAEDLLGLMWTAIAQPHYRRCIERWLFASRKTWPATGALSVACAPRSKSR